MANIKWKKNLAISCVNWAAGYLVILGPIGFVASFFVTPISVGGIVGGVIATILGFLCIGED
jgi:hypothetical protein